MVSKILDNQSLQQFLSYTTPTLINQFIQQNLIKIGGLSMFSHKKMNFVNLQFNPKQSRKILNIIHILLQFYQKKIDSQQREKRSEKLLLIIKAVCFFTNSYSAEKQPSAKLDLILNFEFKKLLNEIIKFTLNQQNADIKQSLSNFLKQDKKEKIYCEQYQVDIFFQCLENTQKMLEKNCKQTNQNQSSIIDQLKINKNPLTLQQFEEDQKCIKETFINKIKSDKEFCNSINITNIDQFFDQITIQLQQKFLDLIKHKPIINQYEKKEQVIKKKKYEDLLQNTRKFLKLGNILLKNIQNDQMIFFKANVGYYVAQIYFKNAFDCAKNFKRK